MANENLKDLSRTLHADEGLFVISKQFSKKEELGVAFALS